MPVRRHQFIEHEILTLALLHSDNSGYPVSLPDLTNLFRERLPDIADSELVDALKRLHPKFLTLRKWSDVRGQFLEYPALGTFRDDGEFFYTRDFRLLRTPNTDPHVQELRELFRAQGSRGESMNEGQRKARFERWESLGLERVKNDLMQTGGVHDVGGPPEVRELAWEWVRMKEAPTKAEPDDALLERVLGNIVNKADESWRDIGRRVLNQASATGLHGRLHLGAKEQIDPLHEAAVNQMVKSISKFAEKNDLPLSSLFQKFEPRFADLNARALKPVEQVARTIFREANQADLLGGQLNAVKTSFEERCKRAQEEKEFEAMNGTEKGEGDGIEPGESFIAATRINELRTLSSPNFDLRKLVRLCEELNSSHMNGNYYATAMLTRGVLDHVPPLFGHLSFVQVASNYAGGGKSFKEAMEHLQGAAKKIGDGHLHTQIRKTETLPTKQQVSCGQQLDLLLGEIIRIMK